MSDHSDRIDEVAAEIRKETAINEQDHAVRPSTRYAPKLAWMGEEWRALLGDDPRTGVAGYGATPFLAMEAFDTAWTVGGGRDVLRLQGLDPLGVHCSHPADQRGHEEGSLTELCGACGKEIDLAIPEGAVPAWKHQCSRRKGKWVTLEIARCLPCGKRRTNLSIPQGFTHVIRINDTVHPMLDGGWTGEWLRKEGKVPENHMLRRRIEGEPGKDVLVTRSDVIQTTHGMEFFSTEVKV